SEACDGEKPPHTSRTLLAKSTTWDQPSPSQTSAASRKPLRCRPPATHGSTARYAPAAGEPGDCCVPRRNRVWPGHRVPRGFVDPGISPSPCHLPTTPYTRHRVCRCAARRGWRYRVEYLRTEYWHRESRAVFRVQRSRSTGPP